jgi:hypothetical protein
LFRPLNADGDVAARHLHRRKKTPGPFPVREHPLNTAHHPVRRQAPDDFLNIPLAPGASDLSRLQENLRMLQPRVAKMTFSQQHRTDAGSFFCGHEMLEFML